MTRTDRAVFAAMMLAAAVPWLIIGAAAWQRRGWPF